MRQFSLSADTRLASVSDVFFKNIVDLWYYFQVYNFMMQYFYCFPFKVIK